jgi:hypothetical protein
MMKEQVNDLDKQKVALEESRAQAEQALSEKESQIEVTALHSGGCLAASACTAVVCLLSPFTCFLKMNRFVSSLTVSLQDFSLVFITKEENNINFFFPWYADICC